MTSYICRDPLFKRTSLPKEELESTLTIALLQIHKFTSLSFLSPSLPSSLLPHLHLLPPSLLPAGCWASLSRHSDRQWLRYRYQQWHYSLQSSRVYSAGWLWSCVSDTRRELLSFCSGNEKFTVDLPLRTLLKWGHLSNKDTFSLPKNSSCMQLNPWNEDTSLIWTLSSVPLVSGLEEFHCIMLRTPH